VAAWTLEGFEQRLDAWDSLEDPPDDLRILVTAWVLSRMDDPYQGVQRAQGFENLWFGTVPKSLHANDRVVVCSYWITEVTHVVRCESFATLSLPI
jgi:hypothetical protein